MARKSSSTAVQEELYPLPGPRDHDASRYDAAEREPFDDSRLVDLDTEQESPFLRGQKRISVRRGSLPRKAAGRLKWGGLALVILVLLGTCSAALYQYGKHNWRFRIDSSDQIEVSGSQHVSHAQIMEVMGGDIGRNIFFIPLAQRKQQIEQIPWVESASVMRFVPNRLRIEIHERTPVAFARIGSHISLIDAGGNLMEIGLGGKHKYSFPVIAGMNASEPLSTRALRMKNYNELLQQLDSSGARYSQELSEVDLTDAEDVKVLTSDPNGEVLVHLGDGNYLQRYRIYVTHLQAWRQQFAKLDSVDLRYDKQTIVNPDLEGIVRQPALTQAAAKAALAAGVKNAAIVNYEKYVPPGTAASAGKAAQPRGKAPAKPESKAVPKNTVKTGPKAVAHRGPSRSRTKTGAVKNPAPAHAGAGLAPSSGTATAHTANTVQSRPAAPAPAARAPVPVARSKTKPASTSPSAPRKTMSSAPVKLAGNQKKPSPAIPKEAPQN